MVAVSSIIFNVESVPPTAYQAGKFRAILPALLAIYGVKVMVRSVFVSPIRVVDGYKVTVEMDPLTKGEVGKEAEYV